MKLLLASLLIFGSLNSFAAANQVDLVECNTEHLSVYAGLIADGSVMQMITTSDNGAPTPTHISYFSNLSENEKAMIKTGDWGIASEDSKGDKLILVVQADGSATIVSNGHPTTAQCKKL